jgi:hypothetical protein
MLDLNTYDFSNIDKVYDNFYKIYKVRDRKSK